MRRRAQSAIAIAMATVATAFGCSGDFDTSRSIPPRGTLGVELFSMICDRVGAQSLREDVTGGSYHAICHPDPTTGAYAATVDQSLLPPLDPNAVDVNGNPVSLAVEEQNRAYNVARIEAVGRERVPISTSLDSSVPDVQIPVKDLANPDITQSCNAPVAPAAPAGGLHSALATTLSNFTDLYDDRTIPLLTEAIGHVLDTIKASPDAQAALARMDARQGYRPNDVALGVAGQILAYPRLIDFANSLLTLLAADSNPYSAGLFDPSQPLPAQVASRTPVPGAANPQWQQILKVLHEELRTETADPTVPPLTSTTDSNDPTRLIYSRPLQDLEVARAIFFPSLVSPPAPITSSSQPLVQRDDRGVAVVPLVNGAVPSPFVDTSGDGLPDINALGQFVTADGTPVPSPFFSVDGVDGPRSVGLALNGAAPMYGFFDTSATILANVTNHLVPLMAPTDEAMFQGFAQGFPLLLGPHDTSQAETKTYPPDPLLPEAWALQHPGVPAPANLGTTPVVLPYAGYHSDQAAVADLVYAIGQVLAAPTSDDTLNLFRQLVATNPNAVARLVGVGLQIKAIANAHPEAHIPAQSTLWDELLDVFAAIAHVYDPTTGGVLEDLITAFGTQQTVNLKDAFTAYIDYSDQLTYQNAQRSPLADSGIDDSGTPDLNGPAFDLSTGAVTPMQTPVDRTQPDSGNNRSALQAFMQLLHDANGLGACTKAGAVAHLNFPVIGAIDYPSAAADIACATFGGGNIPPNPMPECGILQIPDVAQMLLQVALGTAQFNIPDPCLNALLNNTAITGLVGGPNAFLQSQSGINGFDLQPTVAGISRLVYYDTPFDGGAAYGSSAGDPSFPTTENFIAGVLDPVPSMACDPAPFTLTDGGVIPLRSCSSFNLTLRGRDPNALFPLEQLGFIQNIGPLANAFESHNQPLLFVNLFNTLHLHWGSPLQTKAECDPTQPKTSALWCSQDGTVTYEPLLSAALKTDLFEALNAFIPLLQSTTVQHCTAVDSTTGKCTATTPYTGVHVLAEATRDLIDPARSAAVGLTDRFGNVTVTRNDGTTNPQVTPIYLLIDALKEFDTAFANDAAASGGDTSKHTAWLGARSQIVDAFFSVNGTGASSTWANPVVPAMIPSLIDTVRGDLAAYCPTARLTGTCPWARTQLTDELSTIIDGPLFAAGIDLLEAIRSNAPARFELESLIQYLLGANATSATSSAPSDDAGAGAPNQATLTALHDILQLFSDDTNLTPLWNALAEGTGSTLVDDSGQVVRRPAADALIEVLARVLARAYDAQGTEICADEIDPNQTFAKVLGNLVAPASSTQPSPIENLIDAIADVNRANPAVQFTTKLAGTDYANISDEMSDFLENPESGLEQVYDVISEATAGQ